MPRQCSRFRPLTSNVHNKIRIWSLTSKALLGLLRLLFESCHALDTECETHIFLGDNAFWLFLQHRRPLVFQVFPRRKGAQSALRTAWQGFFLFNKRKNCATAWSHVPLLQRRLWQGAPATGGLSQIMLRSKKSEPSPIHETHSRPFDFGSAALFSCNGPDFKIK